MRFRVVEAAQRSPEWFAARAGRLTGSRAADALAFLKSGGEAAARRDYRLQLVAERLTGTPQEDGYINEAMQRGIEKEADARRAYEAVSGVLVRETGFLQSEAHQAGCSLDGHVADFAGIVEIKCPKTATHLGYLRSGVAPESHLAQIRHNLWITGAAWCDFVSFDDRLPSDLQLWVCRVEARHVDMTDYEQKALAFLAEVEAETASWLGWKGAK